MDRQAITEWFLDYNRTHLKSMTKSIKILADKYDVSTSTMRHILGEELLSEAKLNPSNLQEKVLRLMREGNSQSDIARLLKMSRQAVFIAVTEAKKKGLVEL